MPSDRERYLGSALVGCDEGSAHELASFKVSQDPRQARRKLGRSRRRWPRPRLVRGVAERDRKHTRHCCSVRSCSASSGRKSCIAASRVCSSTMGNDAEKSRMAISPSPSILASAGRCHCGSGIWKSVPSGNASATVLRNTPKFRNSDLNHIPRNKPFWRIEPGASASRGA